MNNNSKYRMIAATLAITFLASSCTQNQCGDGICQPLEERKGSCPEDCAKIIPSEPLIEKAFCGNNLCQPEKGENSDNCFSDCKWQSHNPPTSPTAAQMLWWIKKYANQSFPEDTGIQPPVKELKLFREGGCYPDWSYINNLIVFTQSKNINIEIYQYPLDDEEKKKWHGSFEIYTIKPDGTDAKCLTCNKPGAPKEAKGQPFWHPNGEFIVFTAENKNSARRIGSVPGLGLNYDIWIMTADGNYYWRITNYPDNWAVNRAMFSPDGKILHWDEEWSMEKYPGIGSLWTWQNPIGEEGGLWRTKLADISFGPDGPEISNVRIIDHPGLELLEPEGFSRDGSKLIFSAANLSESDGHAWFGDIYTSDIYGGSLNRLTHTPLFHHDENAEYSPAGKNIAWSVCSWLGWTHIHKQEIYLMDSDGSNKKRLTFLNDKDHPEYIESPTGAAAGEITWSPDGKKIVFHVFYDEFKSHLYILTLQ